MIDGMRPATTLVLVFLLLLIMAAALYQFAFQFR